jgi:hypothetical protein
MARDTGLCMGVMGNDLCALFSQKKKIYIYIEHVKYFPNESGLKFNSRIPSLNTRSDLIKIHTLY